MERKIQFTGQLEEQKLHVIVDGFEEWVTKKTALTLIHVIHGSKSNRSIRTTKHMVSNMRKVLGASAVVYRRSHARVVDDWLLEIEPMFINRCGSDMLPEIRQRFKRNRCLDYKIPIGKLLEIGLYICRWLFMWYMGTEDIPQ